MNPSLFFQVLRARFGLFALALCVTVVATLAVSLLLPKTYRATSSLVVDRRESQSLSDALNAYVSPTGARRPAADAGGHHQEPEGGPQGGGVAAAGEAARGARGLRGRHRRQRQHRGLAGRRPGAATWKWKPRRAA